MTDLIKNIQDWVSDRNLNMQVSDIVFETIEDRVEYLKSFGI